MVIHNTKTVASFPNHHAAFHHFSHHSQHIPQATKSCLETRLHQLFIKSKRAYSTELFWCSIANTRTLILNCQTQCAANSPYKAAAKRMNTKYYSQRVLLISSSSPTHELYSIKIKEVETKISHVPGLLNFCIIHESR